MSDGEIWMYIVIGLIILLIIELILWFIFKRKYLQNDKKSDVGKTRYIYALYVVGIIASIIFILSSVYLSITKISFPKAEGISRDTWVTFWGSIIGCTIGGMIGGIVAYKIMKHQLNNEKKRLKNEADKDELLKEIDFCNKILFKYIFSKVEMKCCYDLYEKIGYFDILENKEWLINELGEINKQNKLRALINLGDVELLRVVRTVVNIVGYDKAREYLMSKKLFAKHSHEIYNIASQLEYYCLLVNKLENKGVDVEVIRYKLSLYNEISELFYNLHLIAKWCYDYIKFTTNIPCTYQIKSSVNIKSIILNLIINERNIKSICEDDIEIKKIETDFSYIKIEIKKLKKIFIRSDNKWHEEEMA